jgi:hypothetical protein
MRRETDEMEFAKLTKGRYKIGLDESFHHERPQVRDPDRRWYEQILLTCGGVICLYQEQPTILFKLHTPKQRRTLSAPYERFREVPGVALDTAFADGEAELLFPPELLMEVCEAAGARKKRRGRPLSEKQREAFREGRQKGLAILKTNKNPCYKPS